MSDKNDPSQMSHARAAMEPFLKMIHTILDGTYAMRRAGPMYLPPHPNESEEAYDARLQRTTLLNILEDSIDNACARLFDEPVRLEGEVPPEMVEWAKNIDLHGSSLHEFCDQALHHALADGQVHILVDYPSAQPMVVGGDAEESLGQGQAPAPGNGLDARKGPRPRVGASYYSSVYHEEGREPDQTGNGLNARRARPETWDEPGYDADGNPITGDDDWGDGAGAEGWEQGQDRLDNSGQWGRPSWSDTPNMIEANYGPAVLPEMTLAEERMLGLRPYLCLVPHTNMLAMYTSRVGGETIVTHMRILEEDVVRDGFSEKPVKRVRVLEPGRWELWVESDTGGGWVKQAEGELRKNQMELWDRVPCFTFHCGKRKSVFDVKPPFLDLAYENVAHWQSASDQANILAQARFPMLAVSGFEGEIQTPYDDQDEDGPEGPTQLPFAVGPNAILSTGDPSGKWYYVEPTGQSIDHGAKDLDRREKNMKAMGLEPLTPDRHRLGTATEAGIDEAKSRSPLEEWARRLEGRMNAALATMLDWQAIPGSPHIHFKNKVNVGPQGAQEFANLIQLRTTGNLSKLTMLEEAKRRGLLSAQFNPLEEIARLVIEGPFGDVGPYIGLPPQVDPGMGMGGGMLLVS